jgi:hypothetical protein
MWALATPAVLDLPDDLRRRPWRTLAEERFATGHCSFGVRDVLSEAVEPSEG